MFYLLKIVLLSSVGEVPQLTSLRYQRFQSLVWFHQNKTAKDDCEIGFIVGDEDRCSLVTVVTKRSDCEIGPEGGNKFQHTNYLLVLHKK